MTRTLARQLLDLAEQLQCEQEAQANQLCSVVTLAKRAADANTELEKKVRGLTEEVGNLTLQKQALSDHIDFVDQWILKVLIPEMVAFHLEHQKDNHGSGVESLLVAATERAREVLGI